MDKYNMKKILVIGGNGFIGKNIVDYLQKETYQVGVYDLTSSYVNGAISYVGNIVDDEQFNSIVADYDAIIYLISAIMPKQSMDEPLSSYTTDVPLLIKTLETCKSAGIKRVIYASSGGTIYGDRKDASTEELFSEPINHYAICKLTCEKILMLYNQLYGMENIVLRISNPFGKYQRIASGVGAVTTFAYHIITDTKINIWGDGENIRDYIDVKYVAQAFQLALEWKFTDVVPIFNIGSGVGLSLNKLIEIISDEVQKKPIIVYSPNRNFDVRCNYLDISKAITTLGFKPMKNVEASIREYVRYCKQVLDPTEPKGI